MSWVKQQKLPTVEAIHFQGQPCNDLSNLWRPLHQSYNAAANCSVDLSVLDEVPSQATHFWAPFSCIGVHVHPSDSQNVMTYIKASVNKTLCFCTILKIPNINPDYSYVRLWKYLDNSGL